MLREKAIDNLGHLKRYFETRSDIDIDEEGVFILASTLENPLTMEEISYSTGLKFSICIVKAKKLMEAGLLDRFHPKSQKGRKRGGLFVYQLSEDIASDLGAS